MVEMKLIKGRFYTSDCSDLLVEILKIYFESAEYYKCKIRLTNKQNGIFYSTENVKLYKDKIKHWSKL